MAHSKDVKDAAVQLFREGKSYNEISRRLRVSKGTLSVWLRDISIDDTLTRKKIARWSSDRGNLLANARSVRAENLAARHAAAKLKGEEDAASGNSSVAFFAALYAGEGTKIGSSFKFTNANPEYLVFVGSLLTSYYGVPKERMKISIQYHEGGIGYDVIKSYWSSLLSVPTENFNAPTMKSSYYEASNKHPNGICTLIVNDVLLRNRVMSTVDVYINTATKLTGQATGSYSVL